jgi:pantothenate kinase
MKKIIAVGGNPGSGKTTLLRAFMQPYQWVPVKPKKLLPALYCQSLDLFVLGVYEEGEVFAGTDRLSMSVQPDATEFVRETPSHVLFEGDRIFNRSFLEFAAGLDGTAFHMLYMDVPTGMLQERYQQRGSAQSETFLKGRATKYENLTQNFNLMPYLTVMPNTTLTEQAAILSFLHGTIAT